MNSKNIKILKEGGVGVIATDTIYGLVGQASRLKSVERISKIKNRADGKGFVVLISNIEDLKFFGIELSETAKIFLKKFWPGKVSVAFNEKYAFRLPDKADLLTLINETGPLVAPSANPEGQPPAKNIFEAEKYFGDKVDFYEDSGNLDSLPSTLVRINDDKIEVLREGAVKIK